MEGAAIAWRIALITPLFLRAIFIFAAAPSRKITRVPKQMKDKFTIAKRLYKHKQNPKKPYQPASFAISG